MNWICISFSDRGFMKYEGIFSAFVAFFLSPLMCPNSNIKMQTLALRAISSRTLALKLSFFLYKMSLSRLKLRVAPESLCWLIMSLSRWRAQISWVSLKLQLQHPCGAHLLPHISSSLVFKGSKEVSHKVHTLSQTPYFKIHTFLKIPRLLQLSA